MTLNDRQRILLEVVRGHKPWPVLQRHGFKVSYYDGGREFGAEPDPPLQASLSEVSEGLLRLLSNPHELREWASFVLVASSLIDLEETEGHDLLLEALWDAGFRETIKEPALRLVSRLT
jgi:hypothetical protein